MQQAADARVFAISTCAVRDASIELNPGELCALVGESGSGKSTLARMLAGIIAPSEGSVLLDGASMAPPARRHDRRLCASVQMVLQDSKSALDPRYTVYRSIAEPVRCLLKLTRSDERALVSSLLDRVELPQEPARRRAAELSGGQQKRVCIARALATKPPYLIFDEAVSGLDVLIREKILDLIRDIHRDSGSCTVMITHDMDVALYLADRIVVMQHGSIVEDRLFEGDPSCLTHPYSRLLLEQMEPYAGMDVAGNT